MTESECCEICHGASRLWATISGYPHFRCLSCDHLFVAPRPDQITLDEFYQSGKYYGAAEQQIERLQLEASIRARRLWKLADKFDLPHRLLDVGCASGVFLRAAQKIGWSVIGLDRSAATALRAQDTLSCPIHIGIIEAMRIPGSPFPIVTAWEVLEHTVDPRVFFKALSENVQEGGLLALSTPLGNGLIARLLGVHFPMLMPPEHLSLFSRKSLERLASEFGFDTVDYRSFSNLGVKSLTSGLCKFVFRRRMEDCNALTRVATTVLAYCLAWIPPLIDAAKLGSEMEVVFRKKMARTHHDMQ